MTESEIYDYAQQHGHEIFFKDLFESDAISVEVNGTCFICIDALTPKSSRKEVVAHELGHCEYSGFYRRDTPLNTRGRLEYRARKWAFLHLVPLGELREALKAGITAPWDLAEHFGVSEQFILDACEYYTNACGPITEEEAG